MTSDDLEIIILGTTKRHILTKDYIKTASVYYNQDWEPVPFDLPPNVSHMSSIEHEPRPYRCFRGHQEALRNATKDYVLLLEDDAIPNRSDWMQTVLDSCELLDQYEFVSLHAREICGKDQTFIHKQREYCTLKPISNSQATNMCWALAALAYLVKKKPTIEKAVNEPYCGVPFDIWLYNQKTCILTQSPFDHNRKFGSIIERSSANLGVQRAV